MNLQQRRHSGTTRKKTVEKVQKLREELESLKKEIALAKQNYDLEKAAELQYGRLPQLEGELAAEEEKK